MTPRLAAEFVLAFLDAKANGSDAEAAVHKALTPLCGAGAEQLKAAVWGNSRRTIADNLECIAGEWGAASLASLAFALRSERAGAASNAYLQRQAEADAFSPSAEACTAALFVVACLNGVERGEAVQVAVWAAAQSVRGRGQDALIDAVGPGGFGTALEVAADRLDGLATTWASPVLAGLAAGLRQGGLAGSMRDHLRSCASAEARLGLATSRRAVSARPTITT